MNTLQTIISQFDWRILDAIQTLRSGFLDSFMPKVTVLGNAGIFWILLSLLLICYPKTRKCGLTMALALAAALVLGNFILKPGVARLRPFLADTSIALLIPPPEDFSFPSGHTYAGIASAIVLWRYNWKVGIPAMVLAILIAFSRMYLQVHFPTDILGGVILGILCAALAIWLAGLLEKRRQNTVSKIRKDE